MDLFEVFSISAAGMSVDQARLATAASNLANARTTQSSNGTEYRPLAVVVRSASTGFDSLVATLPRPVVEAVEPTTAAPRMVYDPGHPDADSRGFVNFPGVDPLSTMLELVAVSRSYEANLRAFDLTRTLIQRTLEMGRNS
jgi:flagellar basal-body rod protein FlgC